MKKISRRVRTALAAGLLGALLMTGCAGSPSSGETAVSSAVPESAAEEQTMQPETQPETQAEEVGEKPRLVEDEDEDFTPDRALMKANQVQNEGDADIYPVEADKKNEKKDYSVFIYMVGSDLEASYGYATRDMQEMTDSGIDYSKNNLLVYTGGSRMWKSDIPSNQNNILDMSKEDGERVVAATKHTSDMGAPETLAPFLEYGVTYYPADHYALIFWDHGGGSVYGYGNDTLYSGDSLLLHELDDVMAASPFGEGGSAHLDWVGFDACLMSTAENAVVWSRYADYMVASEETEPGDGWCYSFMNILNEGKSAPEIGKAIVDAYKAYYEAKKTPLNDPDITLAVMDLQKTGALVDSIDALTREMGTDIAKQKFPELVRSRSSTKTFGIRDGRSTAYDLLDIGDLSEKMKEAYPKETAAIDKALGELIIYNADVVEGSCGLSLYFPGENRALYEAAVSNGKEDLYISEDFADFVDLYAEKWMTASDADWTLPEIEPHDNEITLQLTKEQAENLDKATYTVLLDQGDGYYRRGLCKVEVEPDENNVLHIPKDPSLIFAASDFGQMSVPCAFAQSDVRDSAATYDSMRIFLCYGTEMTSSPYDYVTATVEETDGAFSVKSFRIENNASAAAGGKNTVDLSEYVALNEYTSDMLYPTRGQDGEMLPYYQWEVQTGTFSAHLLQIDESLHFTGKKASALDTPTAVQVILRDINGTEHGSELCEISRGREDKAESNEITVDTPQGTLKFARHGKEVWLISYSGDDITIEIPSKVDGYPLTRIDDDAIQSAYSLRELVIPEGVKSLGHHAVSWTSSLTELTLPSTLEEVSRAPIGSAEKLEKITVSGKSSAVCDKDGVLFTADGKKLIKYPESKGRSYTVPEGTETIAFEAFCKADLCEIEFPETLKNIENYAFEGCRRLDTLVFPNSLERIGAGAFSEGITFFDDTKPRIIDTVKFGSNLSSIGLEAFSGLPVVSFEISEENTAYSSVNGMVTSKAGDVLVLCPEEIGGSVIVPDGVVGLTPGIFEKLPPGTAFYFPDSLVRMNINDFPHRNGDNYESVYELTIYCSEGSAAETFAVKNGLDHTTVKQGELNLKQYINEKVPALNGFYSFRVYDDHAVFVSYTGSDSSIAVPAVVKGVPVTEFGDGENAVFNKEKSESFGIWTYEDDTAEAVNLGKYGADTLVNVDIPNTVTCINNGAFADISIKIDELVLPDSLEKIGPKAFGGTYSEASVGSLVISEENPNFMSKDGVLFTKDGKTLVRFPTKAKADLKAVTVEKDGRSSRYIYQIPDGCETIGRFAFANTELIDPSGSFDLPVDDFEVRFSPDVRLVDGYAFYGSDIHVVEMNEGLETIGDSAFSRMKLETQELILPSTVTSLGESAFDSVYRSMEDPSGDSSDLVYGFSHIELPEGLKSVGKSVFASYSDSHLTCDELVIGKKLTDIAEGAFNDFYTAGFAVDAKNSAFSSVDGCLLDGSGETLVAVPQGWQGELKVPDGVKKIGKYAIYNCDDVRDIYIGPEVTYIHPQAIYNYNSSAPVIHGVKGSEAERFAAARGYSWKEEKK